MDLRSEIEMGFEELYRPLPRDRDEQRKVESMLARWVALVNSYHSGAESELQQFSKAS